MKRYKKEKKNVMIYDGLLRWQRFTATRFKVEHFKSTTFNSIRCLFFFQEHDFA